MTAKAKNGERRRAAAQMHALAAVRREIGSRDRAAGRTYLREFTYAYRTYDHTLTSQQLDERAAAADVLLVGDYHALPASQRFAASLVEQLAPKRPIVVGVEAVLSRDQSILDEWWRREILHEELRRRLRFDQDWGYEWSPFLQLLTSARDHAEGVYGLDCMPREDFRRIRSRDRHAAEKMREMRERHPGAVILVLFGESHLAPQHLPALIREMLPNECVLTVLQNIDHLYWQAIEEQATAVSMGQDAVCVLNSTPLEKYESYRLCIEKWDGDDQPDYAPAVYNLIFSLARTLGFRLDSPQNRTQPKYLADSLPEVVAVSEESSESECKPAPGSGDSVQESIRLSAPVRSALEERGCIYLAESNTFLVREFRMPWAAAEAARFLYRACTTTIGLASTPAPKLESALAHFGSRLLRPQIESAAGAAGVEGETLYQEYVAGRITLPAIRRLFLGDGTVREQATRKNEPPASA